MKIINNLSSRILRQSKTHIFIKLSLMVSLLLVSINLLAPKPAQAIAPDNPLLGFVMPWDNYDYLVNQYLAPSPCTSANHQSRSPAVTRWVSLANDPTSTSITVDYGTPSINLKYWTAGVICYNSKAMRVSDVLTNISLDPWGASSFTPTILNIDYDWSNPGSYSSTSTSAFTYAPTNGFTQSDTYVVHIYGRVGLRWTNGDGSYSYVCVADGAGSSDAFYSNCPTENIPYSIYVTVLPKPTNWNYSNNSFTSSKSWSGTAPYPRHRPGTNMAVSNTITNIGDGVGSTYTQHIERKVGAGSWTDMPLSPWANGSLGASGSRGKTTGVYPLPDNVPNDTVICFRARIDRFRGVSPSTVTTGNDWRYFNNNTVAPGNIRCVRVYNAPPTISVSAVCSTFTYTVTDPDNDHHNAVLQVDGVNTSIQKLDKSNGTYTFNISAWDDYGTHTFGVQIKDLSDLGQTVSSNPVNVGPCASPTCTITTSPSDIEPGESFSVTSKINYSPGANGRPITPSYSVMTIYVKKPGTVTADSYPVSFTIIPPSTGGKGTTGTIIANQVGKYDLSAIITGFQTTFGCTGDITASNKPYVSFFGNDVFAGVTSLCAGWNAVAGGIKTFTRPDHAGSSVQFAAMALGAIDNNGFSSASLRGPPNTPFRPNGLTMANATNPLGNLGVNHCMPNYWSNSIKAGPADTTSTTLDLSSAVNGRKLYQPPAPGTLNIHGSVGIGQHPEVYVNGDVVIDNNITYAGSSSWANISEIPSFYLIVKGKIYIDKSVTQLDGIYIAQPKAGQPGSGTIYTCYRYDPIPGGSSRLYNNDELYNNCGSQLVINGSFIAQKVKFLRTFGSLRYAKLGEYPTDPAHDCGKAVCAAELFRFSPEIYLTQGLPSETTESYDSITGLPPIL